MVKSYKTYDVKDLNNMFTGEVVNTTTNGTYELEEWTIVKSGTNGYNDIHASIVNGGISLVGQKGMSGSIITEAKSKINLRNYRLVSFNCDMGGIVAEDAGDTQHITGSSTLYLSISDGTSTTNIATASISANNGDNTYGAPVAFASLGLNVFLEIIGNTIKIKRKDSSNQFSKALCIPRGSTNVGVSASASITLIPEGYIDISSYGSNVYLSIKISLAPYGDRSINTQSEKILLTNFLASKYVLGSKKTKVSV